MNIIPQKIGNKTIISIKNDEIKKKPIGYTLWLEGKNSEQCKTEEGSIIFIPAVDFDYVIYAFTCIFPLYDSFNNTTEEQFDPCGRNYFDNQTCRVIRDNMQHMVLDDAAVMKFKNTLIEWIDKQLIHAQYIVVSGNL